MTTRLIINADDYGRTPEISRGIRHAHLHGMVTSSTCMMNMPSVAADIKIAQKETPRLGLGVHLVLTAGKPLLPAEKVPGLTRANGSFLSQETLIEKAAGLDPSIIKQEWRAQVDAFIAAAGYKPTHLDSHHHSSYFTASIFKAMLELAHEYDLPIRLPIAHEQNQLPKDEPDYSADELDQFGPRLLEKFQPRSPDALFTTFYDQGATRAEFLRILRLFLPNSCFEIMCHPGFVDEAFARESGYAFQRQAELEILTDPALRKEVDRLGIKLISFAEL